jgi:fatty acid desaturase
MIVGLLLLDWLLSALFGIPFWKVLLIVGIVFAIGGSEEFSLAIREVTLIVLIGLLLLVLLLSVLFGIPFWKVLLITGIILILFEGQDDEEDDEEV